MGNFVTGSRVTSAPASAIWDLLADVQQWPATFTPHLKAAALDGRIEPGASGWVKTKLPLPRAAFTIVEVAVGESWSWQGRLLWLTMTFDHRIGATAGGSVVTFDVDLDGPLAALVRPVARLTYRPQMERALDLLVAAAETSA